MDYEKVKAERIGLLTDTMNLRAIVREKNAQTNSLEAMVDNYKVVIIPAMETEIKLYKEINEATKDQAKKNLFLGGGGGTLIGILITLLLL